MKHGKNNRPPKWIDSWLDRYCHDQLGEGIRGDLLEIFEAECESFGYRRARRRYVWRALGFFRPTFSKKDRNTNFNMIAMWKNHLVSSLRSLKRHKQYFVINTFGRSLALSCAVLAAIFTIDELSFDKFHAKSPHIFRLYKDYVNPEAGTSFFTSETSGLMGPTMKEDYPEVNQFLRIRPWFDEVIVSYEEKNFVVDDFVFADSTFFQFFDFTLLKGNPRTVLKEPSSVVLTESLASRLYGFEDPVGKLVKGLENRDYLVTGIVKDAPRNSHLQFDAIVSWTTTVPGVGPLKYDFLNNWIGQTHYTYLLLNPGADPAALERKLPEMITKNLPERADQYFLKLQPLDEVYLSSHEILGSGDLKMGSKRFLMIFLLTGILVLIIASFNYINISLAKSTKSMKEVGLRKVIGSAKRQIAGRFLAEALIQVFIALAVSVVFASILLPKFNELSGKDIPLSILFDIRIIAGLFGFTAAIGFFIGIYPAVLISSGPPLLMLKGSFKGIRVGVIRKVLLVGQYSLSTALIVGTLIVYGQTAYLKSQTQNIPGDQVVVLNINNEIAEKRDAFVSRIKSHSNVVSVSSCQAAIGSGTFGTTLFPEGSNSIFNARLLRVDHSFFSTYGIKLTEGHTFRTDMVSDSDKLVVNNAFVKEMGWETGLGKQVKFNPADTLSYEIAGVVEDFHLLSPARYKLEPALMYLSDRNSYNVSIRLGSGDARNTIQFLEEVWNVFADKTPFDYYFVNDWYDEQFKAEVQMLNSAMIFSAISILLCSLGLYGITSLILEQRLREICIRKVLGAGAIQLVFMVNKHFAILVLIGFFIAVPAIWFIGNQWLASFPYRSSIGGFPFVAAGLISLAISGATVSLLTLKASTTNPSGILKSE